MSSALNISVKVSLINIVQCSKPVYICQEQYNGIQDKRQKLDTNVARRLHRALLCEQPAVSSYLTPKKKQKANYGDKHKEI